MKCIQGIQLISGSNEELLPDFQTDFPYIATCAELYKYLSPENTMALAQYSGIILYGKGAA